MIAIISLIALRVGFSGLFGLVRNRGLTVKCKLLSAIRNHLDYHFDSFENMHFHIY